MRQIELAARRVQALLLLLLLLEHALDDIIGLGESSNRTM